MGIKTVFGTNLKNYRKKKGLSQEALAEKVDIGPRHLGMIERGVDFVSADLLERLAASLGVSAAAFFYSCGEKSADDSFINLVDGIVDAELEKAAISIKLRLRNGES